MKTYVIALEIVKESNKNYPSPRSIAPSIFGFEDIKKSVACLLFGGSRKRLPDGLIRRWGWDNNTHSIILNSSHWASIANREGVKKNLYGL